MMMMMMMMTSNKCKDWDGGFGCGYLRSLSWYFLPTLGAGESCEEVKGGVPGKAKEIRIR